MRKYYLRRKNTNNYTVPDYSLRSNILGHLNPDCELFETVKDSIELRSLGVVSKCCIIFFVCEFLRYHSLKYSDILLLSETIFLLEKYLNDDKELPEIELILHVHYKDIEDELLKSICEACFEVLYYFEYNIRKGTIDEAIGAAFSKPFLYYDLNDEIIRQDEFIINFMRAGKHLFYL